MTSRRFRSIRTIVAAGVAALAFAMGAAFAGAQTEPPLRVGVSPTDTFAEGIYAQQAGFFKEAGLNVQLVPLPNSGAIGAAVAGGSIDIGIGNAIAIASAREHGLPFYVIAPSALFIANEPATLLIVGKNSTFASAKDLEGKTIGTIEVRGIMQASIRSWMVKNGADPANVKFIEVPFSTMPAMLAQNRIDAAMIAEPAYSNARPLVREFGNPYAAIANEWYVNVWFAKKDWLLKNRATARTFVTVMRKTAQWANTHRSETAPMLQRVLPLSDDVIARMTRTRFAEGLTPALMQPVLDTAVKYGVLNTPMDAKDLIFAGL